MGPRLRVSSERLEKPGIEPTTPGLEGRGRGFGPGLLKSHGSILCQLREMSLVMRKPVFAYAKTKTQISFAMAAKQISAFVFAT